MSSNEKKRVLPFYQDTGYGFNINGMFSMDAFKSALNYEPRPDDLFIVTYPKCGTTWVQNIVASIFREGKPFTSALEFLSSTPFLEMAGAEAAKTMKRPGAIKLHLPFHLTPWSPQAKYIFVARNPKDCCVSFYHHTKNMSGYKFQNGNFDDFFELFIDGKVDFGDYFDTLLSWYEHKNDPNVLFLTYEQLKADTKKYILKIAEFMGEKYKDMLSNNEDMLNDIIKYSSFDFMKQTLNKQVSELAAMPKDFIQNHPDLPQGLKGLLGGGDGFFDSDPNAVTFVRKGIVGDFNSHLSPEQNRRLEEKFKERTYGTDISELWIDIMNVNSDVPAEQYISPSRPFMKFVDGHPMPGMFDLDCYLSALKYKPRPDDIFVATYPKCGTTWTQNILSLIFSQGKPLTNPMESMASMPFIEMTGAESVENMIRPGTIKTHLPYHLAPRSDVAKYIHIARNPKDCCVSYYYHMISMPWHGFKGSFNEFFEFFITGNLDFGDYYEHLLGWYAHRNDPNFLFMTYEEMKENPVESVLKMATFLDDKLYAEPLRNDPEKLNDVLKHSSFKNMKDDSKALVEMFGTFLKLPKEEILKLQLPQVFKKIAINFPESLKKLESFDFIRKGEIADWKNHFTDEQNKRIDKIFAEKTKGTDIPELWKNYM